MSAQAAFIGRNWTPSYPGKLAAFASPLALLALWWAVTQTDWYPPQILVPPARVFDAFVELLQNGQLYAHLAASLSRLAIGFLCGSAVGIVFGVLSALFKPVETYTTPFFNAIRQVPSIAFIPILILVFGIDETVKVLVVAKATFFAVGLATFNGVKGVQKGFFEVAACYRLSRFDLVRRVVVPAALPSVVTGLRLGLARSWGVLVAAELIASELGIGQMMEFGRQIFRLDIVMVGVIITGVIGFTIDRSLKVLERRLERWKAR